MLLSSSLLLFFSLAMQASGLALRYTITSGTKLGNVWRTGSNHSL